MFNNFFVFVLFYFFFFEFLTRHVRARSTQVRFCACILHVFTVRECVCMCGLRVQLLLLATRAIQTGIHSRTTAAISSQNKVIKASAKNRNMRVCR